MDELDTFLSHYGVKGMRWGVRKRSTKEESARKEKFKRFRRKQKSDPKTKMIKGKAASEEIMKEIGADMLLSSMRLNNARLHNLERDLAGERKRDNYNYQRGRVSSWRM